MNITESQTIRSKVAEANRLPLNQSAKAALQALRQAQDESRPMWCQLVEWGIKEGTLQLPAGVDAGQAEQMMAEASLWPEPEELVVDLELKNPLTPDDETPAALAEAIWERYQAELLA